MTARDAQDSTAAHGQHLMLFDGVCGLCSGLVQVVLRHDRHAAFDFAALQSPEGAAALAPFGGRPSELDTFVVITNYRDGRAEHLTRARAALVVMKTLGPPWSALSVALGVLPVPVLNGMYNLVARHRYRVFGTRERCFMPGPDHRRRFIDLASGTPPEETRK